MVGPVEGLSEFLFYQTEGGETRVQVSLFEGTVWMTQRLIAELYQKSIKMINEHIENIYEERDRPSGNYLEIPDSSVRRHPMKTEIMHRLHRHFEDYVHNTEGVEFRYARDLQKLLGYRNWRNFLNVIEKTRGSCKTAKHEISDHFVGVNKMVPRGLGSEWFAPSYEARAKIRGYQTKVGYGV